MHGLICFGEITFDTIGISYQRTLKNSAFILDTLATAFFGGRGANVATFFSIWQPGAALLGSAGEDFVQSGYRSILEKRGVDCREVLIENERPTPQAFVFHTGDTTEAFFYRASVPNADSALRDHVRRVAERERASIVYCTSGLQDLNLHLLEHVRSDLKVYAPGPQIFNYPKPELEPFLSASDIIFLNKTEAEYLVRTMEMKVEEINRQYQLHSLVVTRGAQGCTVYERLREWSLPACQPDAIIDPTGAGDSFAGSFLAEFLRTGDIKAAATLAVVASSFVIQKLGCQESLPTQDQAMKRLAEYVSGRRIAN